ncbi:UNVERIFIED_CONTAM: hypothetical protein HDU68_000479 [Siphonaria sp. JEL0065]|nr:hypothetical protein HDU68_000479 [Siphonaria sp. JEL0065]
MNIVGLSDGRESLLPTGDDLVLANRSSYWKPVDNNHTTSLTWRKQIARVKSATEHVLNPQNNYLGLTPLDTLDGLKAARMDRLMHAVEKAMSSNDLLDCEPVNEFPTGYQLYFYAFERKADKIAREAREAQEARSRDDNDSDTPLSPIEKVSQKKKDSTKLMYVAISNLLGQRIDPIKQYSHEGGKTLRIDPYLCGHPAGRVYKFRSSNETIPHIIWLVYGYLATHSQPDPHSDPEWSARDVSLCRCIYCHHYVQRLRSDIYHPLTRPMILQSNRPKHDITAPSAVFRVHEQVWARILISHDKDSNERKIEIAKPVFNSLIADLTKPHGFNVNTDATANGKVIYWPCVVMERYKALDGEIHLILSNLKTMKRTLAVTDGSVIGHQSVEEQQDFLPQIVGYTVKLLGFSDGAVGGDAAPGPVGSVSIVGDEEFVLRNVTAGSLEPYLLRRGYTKAPSFDSSLPPEDTEFLKAAYDNALAKITLDATKWSPEAQSAILFGNELIRVGDVIRLKSDPDSGSNQETLLTVTSFPSVNEIVYVQGYRWQRDEAFSTSFPEYQTRMVSWRMVDDASIKDGSTQVKVKLIDQVAGRMYPIVHDGLKTDSLVAARCWHDWQGLVDSNRAMPVRQLVVYRTTRTTHDDGDILTGRLKAIGGGAWKSVDVVTKSGLRDLQKIGGPAAKIMLPHGGSVPVERPRTAAASTALISTSMTATKRPHLQIAATAYVGNEESDSEDEALVVVRKKKRLLSTESARVAALAVVEPSSTQHSSTQPSSTSSTSSVESFVCSKCSTKETPPWRCDVDSGNRICSSCYNCTQQESLGSSSQTEKTPNATQLASVLPPLETSSSPAPHSSDDQKVCSHCSMAETSAWRGDKGTGKYLCNPCDLKDQSTGKSLTSGALSTQPVPSAATPIVNQPDDLSHMFDEEFDQMEVDQDKSGMCPSKRVLEVVKTAAVASSSKTQADSNGKTGMASTSAMGNVTHGSAEAPIVIDSDDDSDAAQFVILIDSEDEWETAAVTATAPAPAPTQGQKRNIQEFSVSNAKRSKTSASTFSKSVVNPNAAFLTLGGPKSAKTASSSSSLFASSTPSIFKSKSGEIQHANTSITKSVADVIAKNADADILAVSSKSTVFTQPREAAAPVASKIVKGSGAAKHPTSAVKLLDPVTNSVIPSRPWTPSSSSLLPSPVVAPPKGPPFICGKEGCERSYNTLDLLKRHLNGKWLACKACDMKFHRKITALNHEKQEWPADAPVHVTYPVTDKSGAGAKMQGGNMSSSFASVGAKNGLDAAAPILSSSTSEGTSACVLPAGSSGTVVSQAHEMPDTTKKNAVVAKVQAKPATTVPAATSSLSSSHKDTNTGSETNSKPITSPTSKNSPKPVIKVVEKGKNISIKEKSQVPAVVTTLANQTPTSSLSVAVTSTFAAKPHEHRKLLPTSPFEPLKAKPKEGPSSYNDSASDLRKSVLRREPFSSSRDDRRVSDPTHLRTESRLETESMTRRNQSQQDYGPISSQRRDTGGSRPNRSRQDPVEDRQSVTSSRSDSDRGGSTQRPQQDPPASRFVTATSARPNRLPQYDGYPSSDRRASNREAVRPIHSSRDVESRNSHSAITQRRESDRPASKHIAESGFRSNEPPSRPSTGANSVKLVTSTYNSQKVNSGPVTSTYAAARDPRRVQSETQQSGVPPLPPPPPPPASSLPKDSQLDRRGIDDRQPSAFSSNPSAPQQRPVEQSVPSHQQARSAGSYLYSQSQQSQQRPASNPSYAQAVGGPPGLTQPSDTSTASFSHTQSQHGPAPSQSIEQRQQPHPPAPTQSAHLHLPTFNHQTISQPQQHQSHQQLPQVSTAANPQFPQSQPTLQPPAIHAHLPDFGTFNHQSPQQQSRPLIPTTVANGNPLNQTQHAPPPPPPPINAVQLAPQQGPGVVCGLEGCTRVYPTERKMLKHRNAKQIPCGVGGCPVTAHRAQTIFEHRKDVHKITDPNFVP